MINIEVLEGYYNNFISNIHDYLPEGIIDVDLSLLQKYEILDLPTHEKDEASITRFFQMLETDDKVALVNEEFIIWIVPDNSELYSSTYLLIALNEGGVPKLETAYKSQGVYNITPRVLHLLEHVLCEIQENEEFLSSLKDNN